MYKMVVVDDEPLMLEGISKAMNWEANGYQLIGTFRNPFGLIEFCREQNPDILLLDITMPDEDGIEILKKIKSMFPYIKVIMLTAHSEFSYVSDSLRYHADGYLWKPEIGFQDILERMNEVMKAEKMESKEKKIYEFTDYQERKGKGIYDQIKKTIHEMECAFNIENPEKIREDWQKFMKIIGEKGVSKEKILSDVLHIFHLCRKYFENNGIQYEKDEEQKILALFYKNNSCESFVTELSVMFDQWYNMILQRHESGMQELKRKIVVYLNENMADPDMNLLQLANAVGLSYSYCSRIFAELIGMNFSKYLIDIRMEKACEYLKNSNLKLDEILEKVGYIDKSYFVKSFRQHTSLTPSKYRAKFKTGRK